VRPPVVSASEALRFLHRAGELLGGSLDFEHTLRRVAQLTVPDIADWCGVYAISEDGPPQEVTSVHPDPEVEALIVEIRRRRRRDESGSESLEVMRSRRSVLVTEVPTGYAPDVAEAERAVIERLGPSSYMIVPLVARGRVLGAMTLLSTRPGRHYTEEDLRFAETIGAHFALVIDNARLYDAAEQSVGLLDTFFAIAPVGLGFLDSDLRYVRVNDAFAGFSERPAGAHIGRTAREILGAGELAERVAELHRRVLESGEPLLDVELSDGTRYWSASYTPVRGLDGQVIGLGIVLVDVTERRRLLEAERDARLRADFLARAGAILDESLVYEETLATVAQIAVPDIADWCSVSVLDRDGILDEVARHHTDPAKLAVAQEITERFPTPMNAPGGAPKVARTGTTEFVPEITDEMLMAALPDREQLALVRALGLKSIIIAPLRARGRTFGTLTLAHAESGRRFSAADVQLAEELAHRAGQAIENARLYTERARIAHLLQVKLLPERLPEIPGARVAARYRAAGELNEVGGDFYDVFARSADEWALVVGDVSGKGAEAAAITALARYTLRAAALEDGPPSIALQRLNQAMLAHDDSSQFATVVLAYAAAGANGGMDVRFALGGHPPPLVLRRDGSVEAPGAFGTILGATPDAALTDVELRLSAGDVLVLYTDGVTEAGARTTPFGQDGLSGLLQRLAGEPPEAVVAAVEQAVVDAQPGEPRDDIAVVALSVSASQGDGRALS
jgi:serine phosphatase RsbU (regulator of sigma subunit)/PAS domain-containing protein